MNAPQNDPLPDTGERFNFVRRLHASLARGGRVWVHVCEDFGITCTEQRKTSRDRWTVTFVADELPGWEYDNLPELVGDLRALHPGEYEGFAPAQVPV